MTPSHQDTESPSSRDSEVLGMAIKNALMIVNAFFINPQNTLATWCLGDLES